jgi:hypothetical protein
MGGQVFEGCSVVLMRGGEVQTGVVDDELEPRLKRGERLAVDSSSSIAAPLASISASKASRSDAARVAGMSENEQHRRTTRNGLILGLL